MATGGIGVFVARLFSGELRSSSRTSRRKNGRGGRFSAANGSLDGICDASHLNNVRCWA